MVKKYHSSLRIHLLLTEVLYYSKFSLKFIFFCYFGPAMFNFRVINTTFLKQKIQFKNGLIHRTRYSVSLNDIMVFISRVPYCFRGLPDLMSSV